jgi:hypothetical protein
MYTRDSWRMMVGSIKQVTTDQQIKVLGPQLLGHGLHIRQLSQERLYPPVCCWRRHLLLQAPRRTNELTQTEVAPKHRVDRAPARLVPQLRSKKSLEPFQKQYLKK